MRLPYLSLALFAATAAAACETSDHTRIPKVTDLTVTNEDDFSLLDVEVHLFDSTTHAHLGCSGQNQGMEPVDASDVVYQLDAHFIRAIPDEDQLMTEDDLVGRGIEMQIIEDDALPCPEPPGLEDDVIGIATVDFTTFDLGRSLSFDDVVNVRVTFD